ncbi:MAG: DinB family protein [Dehalococcoidia bacterium]|uniref:DinB family protein n=1 Tax=Candidatus Amarobacter glycogenicus TaxID=3140699 RepID=UPI001DB7B37C|nr:DinB family protein [Dehalococcoidia bacterium]MBK7726545.1 DinB family protein [Dehalococcoidia bacterium]
MGQPTEAERVRGYILTQANKLTIPELVDKVRTDTAPLREAAASVPEDRFFDRPNSEDWSAAEVFTHILDMNDRGAELIAGILDSGAAPAAVADVMTGETRGGLKHAEDFWQAYVAKREPLLERVLLARGDEYLEVRVRSSFGDLTWREWLLFMRVHDLDHMRQLQTNAAHFGG